MTKVSKRFLDKELKDRIFQLFTKTIVELKDQEEVENFLNDLLSPTEKIMLVKRLSIAILLSKGYTYQAIDNTLKVSKSTIMNVSYWLKYGKDGYQKAIKKIMNSKKREELIDKIEEMLIEISGPKAYGSFAFKEKQKAGKELFKKRRIRNLI